jgi:hypothetical protein
LINMRECHPKPFLKHEAAKNHLLLLHRKNKNGIHS